MGLELERVGRLVEGDPGPERVERHAEVARRLADVLLDEQQPARRRLGATAGRGRTGRGRGVPMKPSRKPSWRVVIQRFASATDGLAEAAAGRHDLVEQVALEAPDERREARRRWPGPSRPGRRRRTARRRPAAPCRAPRSRRGHDPGHRRGVVRPRSLRARAVESAPGARRSRPIATRSTAGQSTRPRRAERSARRPTTVAAAPRAEPTRKPACQMRSSRRRAARRAAAAASRDRHVRARLVATSAKRRPPNSRRRRGPWNALARRRS